VPSRVVQASPALQAATQLPARHVPPAVELISLVTHVVPSAALRSLHSPLKHPERWHGLVDTKQRRVSHGSSSTKHSQSSPTILSKHTRPKIEEKTKKKRRRKQSDKKKQAKNKKQQKEGTEED
jgi:hypothetical protein